MKKQYVNWKDLVTRIPTHVEGPKGLKYEIVWSKDTTKYHGQMIPDKKQIQLALGLSPKKTIETYTHELIHFFADHSGVTLTETDVLLLEKFCTYYIYKQGNIFTEKSSNV